MGKRSRTKGAAGERELVALSIRCGYPKAHRVAPMQAGHSGDYPDVEGVSNFWIEAKRHRRVSVSGFVKALLTNEKPGRTRVLAYREDGDGPDAWKAVIEFTELLKLRLAADWAEANGYRYGASETEGDREATSRTPRPELGATTSTWPRRG